MSDDLTERLRHGRTVQEREQMVIDDLKRRGLAEGSECYQIAASQ